MALYRNSNIKRSRKISTSILLLSLLGLLYSVAYNDFVPHSSVEYVSVLVSSVLAIIVFSMQVFAQIRQPSPIFARYSFSKKVLVVVFTPFLLFFIFWTILCTSLPRIYTSFLGSDAVKESVLVKRANYGRGSCTYSLIFKSDKWSSGYFRKCISEDFYNGLTDSEYEAKLSVKESELGYIVEKVHIYL